MSNYASTVSVSSERGSVSLDRERGKHLASVVMTNIYKMHILLYELINTNLSSLSTFLSNIDNSIKYCQCVLRKSISNIEALSTTSNNCLSQIKTKMIDLYPKFLNLYDNFGEINYLKKETDNIINSYNNTDSFKSKWVRLINAFSCSLSKFSTIESLIICIKSTIREISRSKEQFMNSINTNPSQHLKPGYFGNIKSLSDNVDGLFSAINNIEFYTYCLKYWICKFVNSWNLNTLLTSHCVNYISYFYHVFPLHVNSFNRLFSDVISPKLSILISSVEQFTCLTTDINQFICNLQGVSSYLKSYNPAQSLLSTIDTFNGDSYVKPVRSDIDSMIRELENKINYSHIISDIQLLVKTYYDQLKASFQNFKNKITEYQSSLKEKIQGYIEMIKRDLIDYCCCVSVFIKLISSDLKKLSKNQGKLGEFDEYDNYLKLMKPSESESDSEDVCGTGLFPDEIGKLKTIIETHKKYEPCLKSCFKEIKSKLNELKGKLEEIKNCFKELTNKLKDSEVPNTENIDSVLSELEKFKGNLDYNKYIEHFQELENIGKHITTMKNNLNPIKDKVQDKVKPGVINYIEGLDNIDIKADQVKRTIEKIKGTTDLIIKQLKIAKCAIKFHELLKTQVTELQKVNNENGVTFAYYDIPEFKTNSDNIKDKLTTFQEKINQEIKKYEKEITKLTEQCQETQERANGQEADSISSVLQRLKNDYTSEIQKITKFIEKSSQEIKIIEKILNSLQENKKQSETLIGEINSQVSRITDLNDAIATLPKIKDCLDKVVKLQEDTKSLIYRFSDYPILSILSQFSQNLRDSISESTKLINFINNSIHYFTKIDYVDLLIKWIKRCYEFMIQRIRQIIDNFKDYVNVISSKLETINCDLLKLNCDIVKCCPGYTNNSSNVQNSCNTNNQGSPNYDLGKLKYYMNTLKFYLENIKINLLNIKTIMTKIKQGSSYIDKYQCQLERVEKVICGHIKCLECDERMTLIVNYLKSIKDRINENLSILKYIIEFNKGPKCITKIETKLSVVEGSINDLECAIEGVVRNMIRCSLKSLSNRLTNSNESNFGGINSHMSYQEIYVFYSQICVIEYNVVVNKLFCSLKNIDRIFHLIPSAYACDCIRSLESNGGPIDLSYIGVYTIIKKMSSDSNINEMLKLKEIKKVNSLDSSTNHLCLCMVIKYVLYLQILKLMYIFEVDLEVLSTSSRKFDKYPNAKLINSNTGKIFLIITKLLYNVGTYILVKYEYSWSYSGGKGKSMCYCTYSNDTYYPYLISLILYLSSLIQNIWTMDKHAIVREIQSLSSLLTEFDMISYKNTTKTSAILDDPFKGLFCPLKFCRLSSKLPLILDIVSLSKHVSILDSVIRPYIQNLHLSNINSFESALKQLKQYGNTKDYFDWIQKQYNSIYSSKNICGQFKNQCCVLSSTVMLFLCLIISCKIKAKLYTEKGTQIKERLCEFLKSICNCKNNDCCIEEILGSKDQLCNGKNGCENLLKKCVNACCDTKCCNGTCPCKQLKTCCDKLKKLCCNDSQNGLCKILEKMSKCLKEDCGQCNCSCCKIVIEGILIIQEMFKLNVSNISKNIIISCNYLLEIMDKIKGTKNSELIVKLIIENNIRIKILSTKMSKNNYSTHFNTYSDHKNIANSFPSLTMGYGYDVVYEHQEAVNSSYTDINGIREGYPNVGSGRITKKNKLK